MTFHNDAKNLREEEIRDRIRRLRDKRDGWTLSNEEEGQLGDLEDELDRRL